MNNENYRILIAEDDNDINKLISTILRKEGYDITSAFSGTEAMLLIDLKKFDLLLLDLMLPGLSGEEVLKKLRQKYNIPVIVLTAKCGLDDKVNVLSLGADDYITKPFEVLELIARVKAQLRRSNQFNTSVEKQENSVLNNFSKQKQLQQENSNDDNNNSIRIKELTLNPEAMTVRLNDNNIELTTHEFKILKLLMENPDKVYSKDKLYEIIWENGYYGEDNTVSVHVSNIRKKLAIYSDYEYIKTVWGIGYKLNL